MSICYYCKHLISFVSLIYYSSLLAQIILTGLWLRVSYSFYLSISYRDDPDIRLFATISIFNQFEGVNTYFQSFVLSSILLAYTEVTLADSFSLLLSNSVPLFCNLCISSMLYSSINSADFFGLFTIFQCLVFIVNEILLLLLFFNASS